VQLRVADTFTDSLAKLTGEEQKAVKTTAFDLHLSPANASFSVRMGHSGRPRTGALTRHLLCAGWPAVSSPPRRFA
jgi:hypothetical protein